ncbi:MAG TPA: hypothetical protein VD962_06520 [Rubricoccaceae bacterium]|nr:hypothetical protein [Rubricoccaceae bacterium]
MSPALLSALLGVTLGVANAVASYALWRAARHRPQATFLKVMLGGMVARMVVVLALLTLVLVVLPVHAGWLVGAFFLAFGIGVVVEVILLRRASAEPLPAEG